jgi:hypothetical protein
MFKEEEKLKALAAYLSTEGLSISHGDRVLLRILKVLGLSLFCDRLS